MKKLFLNGTTVEIPEHVRLQYCEKKNQLVLIGPLKTITIFPEFKMFFKKKAGKISLVYLVSSFTHQVSKNIIKKSRAALGTFASKLQQIFVELRYELNQTLKLVGVGYRAFILNEQKEQIMLKLGFSHLVYYGLPVTMGAFCVKFTKLYVFGNVNYSVLRLYASRIRNLKLPEPYKGKGILYWEEIVKLKIGKRV